MNRLNPVILKSFPVILRRLAEGSHNPSGLSLRSLTPRTSSVSSVEPSLRLEEVEDLFVSRMGGRFFAALRMTVILVLMLIFAGQALAAAGDLSVRIETPKSPTRENSFKIGFVALDTQGRPVSVKCLKKGPSEAGFSQFGSDFALVAGGSSGDCEVTSAILSSQGTYEFKISAAAGEDLLESNTVTVSYSTDSPGTPSSYSKEQLSSCDYKIKFKTADDGRTSKVKIYRSTETSFTADSSTEVGTVNIGPNLEGSFTNSVPDCGKTYYYAIRAFDDAGNASGVTGDTSVTVVTKTTTLSSPATTLTGAIPVSTSQAGEGEILGEATEAGIEAEEGILGEATPEAEISPAPSPSSAPVGNLFSLRNIIIGLALILVVYFLYRRLSE